MTKKHHLAELQLAIVQVLWERGPSTVGEVRDALRPGRDLAYTTVGTMLAKMEEKDQVVHRTSGRVNVYRAKIRQDQVRRIMVSDLARRLFEGDVTEMVCHLLDSDKVSQSELEEMKRLIRAKERELRDDQ